MTRKRLVLLVEGDGDVEAAPVLLARLLHEYQAFDAVFLDPHPFRVGEYSKISRQEFAKWRRYLRAVAKRKDLGGCLLLLDGDSRAKVEGQPFCAMRAAGCLADEARKEVAGRSFSVAIVFACTEYESWLIAGVQSLGGKQFTDGSNQMPDQIKAPPPHPESAPRDAKGWLGGVMKTGYKPTRDQAELTRLVDLNLIRRQEMRSFRRLESAVQGLVRAVRCGEHAVTPASA